MKDIIAYMIQFLLGEQNSHLADRVAYANSSSAAVVIVPSPFFDDHIYMTQATVPRLPLKEIDGVPLLFGEAAVIREDNQVIVKADIIASAFFLITRYEECLNRSERDKYGRFIGKMSLPYRAGFLMRPVVDEYGQLLRKWLRESGIHVVEPPATYRHVYLTHDIDAIWQWDNLYRALRTFGKRVFQRRTDACESLRAWYDYERFDKIYTFPWMAEVDQDIINYLGKDRAKSVYFVKTGGISEIDALYYKKTMRVKKLLEKLGQTGAVFGIHASFSAGEAPEKIREEKEQLEKILGEDIKWNRHHYLCSREPEDMEALIAAGITDDFTMGYADVAGFRLGTSRAVRWMNPVTKKLTSLTLHPLTIMECTLDSENYMNLDEEEAYETVGKLLKTVIQYNGEVILLWHNSSVTEDGKGYQRKLYKRTLSLLKECSKCDF